MWFNDIFNDTNDIFLTILHDIQSQMLCSFLDTPLSATYDNIIINIISNDIMEQFGDKPDGLFVIGLICNVAFIVQNCITNITFWIRQYVIRCIQQTSCRQPY